VASERTRLAESENRLSQIAAREVDLDRPIFVELLQIAQNFGNDLSLSAGHVGWCDCQTASAGG
jgi:hypothetical protein